MKKFFCFNHRTVRASAITGRLTCSAVSLETQPDPREAKQNSTVRSEIVETLKSFPLSIACFASALEQHYAVHVLTTKQCAQTGRAVKFESCLHAVAAQRPEDGHTSLVEGHVHMNAGSGQSSYPMPRERASQPPTTWLQLDQMTVFCNGKSLAG